jgi:hypothetical protein
MSRAILRADARVLQALAIVLGAQSGPVPGRIDRRFLRSAFRRRAHELHPDKARGLGMSEAVLVRRFHELKHAYDTLLSALASHVAIVLAADDGGPRPTIVVPSQGRRTDVHPRIVRAQAPRGGVPRAAARAGMAAPTAGTADPRPGRDRPDGRPRPVTREGSAAAARVPSRSTSPQRPSFRHTGSIPARRLRFAQYLYYAGVIDWATLMAAMRWQQRTRPLLGQIARQLSYLTLDDVCAILRERALGERFGDAAVRLRRLDKRRLLTIIGRQRRFDRPIGRYFTENRIVRPEVLARLLERHVAHNLACAAAEIGARQRNRRVAGG